MDELIKPNVGYFGAGICQVLSPWKKKKEHSYPLPTVMGKEFYEYALGFPSSRIRVLLGQTLKKMSKLKKAVQGRNPGRAVSTSCT
jgi:hypothetical protein